MVILIDLEDNQPRVFYVQYEMSSTSSGVQKLLILTEMKKRL